ncbi:unnamed protein product [Microthlaspi erraticum]|uniref:Uncharacterized protein n=1 Tax=Microthlaspi erraticum TaxID=1685480 RepID=A0A6D2I4P2_9BRAS|nr:unnamed protein product [Microthlaspi erraticum]
MRMYHRGEIPPMDGDRSQGKSFPPRPPKSGHRRSADDNPVRGRMQKRRKPPGKRNRDDHDDLPPPPKRQVSMIMGGLLDNDDSISAIKEYERKAVAAQRYPYIHKGIPTSPLRIRMRKRAGHPSPRPTRGHSTDSRL